MEKGERRFTTIPNKTEYAKRADQQESPPSINDPDGCSPSPCVSQSVSSPETIQEVCVSFDL